MEIERDTDLNDKLPLWALASGCIPEVRPQDMPAIVGEAGFNSCGLWIDPDTSWNSSALRQTRQAIANSGISVLDVEVVWIADGVKPTDKHLSIIEAGAELDARNVLIITRHKDEQAAVDIFSMLSEACAKAGLNAALEFGEFSQVKTLPHALDFISKVNQPSAKILIDTMHLHRSLSESPTDAMELIKKHASEMFPYVQLCDVPDEIASLRGDAYLRAALDDRSCLGEGDLDIGSVQSALPPGIDVSLEIRSKAMRDYFPDPLERAKTIYKRCQPYRQ